MTVESSTVRAAVLPGPGGIATLRPIPTSGIRLTDGFWEERLRRNREHTIPHGFEQLTQAGTLDNFRLAAGAPGSYRALGVMFDQPFPFLLGKREAHDRLVPREGQVDQAADAKLDAASDKDLVAAGQVLGDGAHISESHHGRRNAELRLPPVLVDLGRAASSSLEIVSRRH